MCDVKAPERIPHCTGCGEYPGDGVADKVDAITKERDELQAEVERLRRLLNNIYENVEYWNTLQISSKIRAALQRKEGDE